MPAGEPTPAVPRVVLDAEGLTRTVARLAGELDATHDDRAIVVSTLKGAMVFASDLLRRLQIHPFVDFVAVAPFEPGRRASLVRGLDLDVEGAPVILVTDVIDTGLSLRFVLDELDRQRPASVTVCALVDKPHRRLVPVEVHHVGLTVDDDFLIGYGLDFGGRYRNLSVLAAADLDRLAGDPDCYLRWAYGNRAGGSEDSTVPG